MTAHDPSAVASEWERCSLPLSIATWLRTVDSAPIVKLGSGPEPHANVWFERALRFVRFADGSPEQQDALQKAWAAVARSSRHAAGGDSAELLVFMGLPDRVEYNPFGALYAGRQIDAKAISRERKHYKDLGDHVAAVLHALEGAGPVVARTDAAPKWTGLLYLLQDAQATQESHPDSGAGMLAQALRNVHLDPLINGLRGLQSLLSVVKPADKVLTDQWGGDAAPQTVFASLVANLNRHLEQPQHAALERLAKINCPMATVTREQLRKQWVRTDKQG